VRALGHGFYELVKSTWSKDIATYNKQTYGKSKWSFDDLRHFFIGSKDVTAQFLARDVGLEVFDLGVDVCSEALRRMDRYPFELSRRMRE
jgi:hypothetical protein